MENKKPLSPHIQIYSWNISSLISISHRITGVINILIFTLICLWIGLLMLGESNYEYIKFLGLSNQKSKNIYNLSKLLIDKHKGKVPDSFEKLESLPGVGHKTASVVMSQVFKIPSFPVDTHIHRLSQRWGLSNGDSVVQTEKDLKKIFPVNDWNTLHLQIIFYGREYCTARGCDGTKCYLCRTLYPKRKKKFICKKP